MQELDLKPQIKILLVDDDSGMRFVLEEFLKKEGYLCDIASDGQEALEKLSEGYSLVLMDIKMPRLGGLPALDRMKQDYPHLLVIMMTAYGSKSVALEAIEKGAYDYFTKPFDLDDMRVVLKRAAERFRLQEELSSLKQKVNRAQGPIIGQSSSLRRTMEMVDKVAGSDITVLITGESGTGKELIAREIHDRSQRAKGPFVVVNCTALPESLLEMELFGYEKGAYTGAHKGKPGKFEVARGGTIFLDEVAELKTSVQSKILRVLQEREIDRVGGLKPTHVDLRFIAATHQDLGSLVDSGIFRKDLYYRLNVLTISVDPLRDRPEDIPPLAEHFLDLVSERLKKSVSHITSGGMDRLIRYPWPGNVRELENMIQRGVVLAKSNFLDEAMIEEIIPNGSEPSIRAGVKGPLKAKIGEYSARAERKIIEEMLGLENGKRVATALRLGISRKNLYNKMRKYGLL